MPEEKWEAMLQGRFDSREVCVTFSGSQAFAEKAARRYALNHGMEVLFLQQPQVSNRGFFGGIYA